ncbi:gamma-glutamylcyclotransferase family protein [Vibrio coralliilyticus]|uniref:gamma-glutamylcyclotransferase family protein n=1 Tax=Vibrio coralliilyticus TaxID=190893 RepID=UPI000C171915|nr:gamma-glutamylcyclotransferase [Vibrio coralliilyticus]
MQHLLFVYGTLRQGESNHNFLADSQCLGHFETPPHYALYDLGTYPAVIEGHDTILGEVYLIDDETLARVDKLEDVPVEYRREQIETPFGEAWIYLYQDGSMLDTIISSGDWCQKV